MTNDTFTAEEVRELARHSRAAAQSFADGTVRAPEWATLSGIESALTAYADLLERREVSVTDEVVEAAMIVLNRAANVAAGLGPDDEPITEEERKFLRAGTRAALEAVWPIAAEPSDKAKLSERKTVHEWLNALHIEREEFGKPLCLLRRLRILCDRYQETCDQLSHEMHKQIDAEPVAQAEAGAWIEQWEGSGPQRGWHIRYKEPVLHGNLIAYLGDSSTSEEISALVTAHNESLQSRTVPEGWMLVPREPTQEMIQQGSASLKCDVDFTRRPQMPTRQRAARNAFVSMLTAAPQPGGPS